MRKRKEDYFKAKLLQNKNDIKKTWEILNEITSSAIPKKREVPQHIIIDGLMVDTESEKMRVASAFNKMYVEVGKKLAEALPVHSSLAREYLNKIQNNINTIFLTPTHKEEVERTISQMRVASAPGSDQVSVLSLKNCASAIAEPLAHIINRIFETGIFPETLKTSVVVPLYKGGEKHLLSSWRPVSLVSVFSKLVEKLILKRFNVFIEKHNLIANNQFGFLKNSSTNSAIFELIKKLQGHLDKGSQCIVIFMDVTSAFSSIPHSLLLSKMEKMGFRGVCNQLLKSYLANRPQMVRFNECISEQLRIADYSCPQGTCCSPTLFNLFLNDLLKLPLRGEISAYADDTALLCWADSVQHVFETAAQDFEVVKTWFEANGLTLNLNKTVYIDFCKYTKHPYTIPNITPVDHFKYLGVVIDKKLKWDVHINLISKKMRKTIYKFVLLRHIVDRETMNSVYYALVQSHLLYGILAWGSAYQNVRSQVEVVQKKILKIMLSLPSRYPSDRLFEEAGFLTVNQLFIREAILHTFKSKTELEHPGHEHDTRWRARGAASIQQVHTARAQRQADYIGLKYYNQFTPEIKQLNNFALKCFLKDWIPINIART